MIRCAAVKAATIIALFDNICNREKKKSCQNRTFLFEVMLITQLTACAQHLGHWLISLLLDDNRCSENAYQSRRHDGEPDCHRDVEACAELCHVAELHLDVIECALAGGFNNNDFGVDKRCMAVGIGSYHADSALGSDHVVIGSKLCYAVMDSCGDTADCDTLTVLERDHSSAGNISALRAAVVEVARNAIAAGIGKADYEHKLAVELAVSADGLGNSQTSEVDIRSALGGRVRGGFGSLG